MGGMGGMPMGGMGGMGGGMPMGGMGHGMGMEQQQPEEPAAPEPPKEFIAHLRGLPWKVTVDQIKEFAGCNPDHITNVVLVKDETGRPAGEAYVIISNRDAALMLISQHKQTFLES